MSRRRQVPFAPLRAVLAELSLVLERRSGATRAQTTELARLDTAAETAELEQAVYRERAADVNLLILLYDQLNDGRRDISQVTETELSKLRALALFLDAEGHPGPANVCRDIIERSEADSTY